MWQSIILLSLLFLPSVIAPANFCHRIPEKEKPIYENFKDCIFYEPLTEDANFFGCKDHALVLDFSRATEKGINEFFGKNGSNIDTLGLMAGVALVDNNNVETLNLSIIAAWTPNTHPYPYFINIHGNTKLKRIIWPRNINITKDDKERILIYNNPLLKLEETRIKELENVMHKDSYIQKYDNECNFEDMTVIDHKCKKYLNPSQELLNDCRIIVDSLYLTNRTLPRDVHLIGTGCIRLENVNFNGYRLDFKNHSISSNCRCDGDDGSLIKNPNLCGKNMTELYSHLDNGQYYALFQVDHNTCTGKCTAEEALHPHYLCSEILEDVDISVWFQERQKFAAKFEQKLVRAHGILTIKDVWDSNIEFKYLRKVEELQLIGNRKLCTLGLNLTSVQQLTVIDNGDLPFTQFPVAFERSLKKLPDMDKSKTECNTDGTTITNFEMIRLCTRIKGPLKLEKIPVDSNLALFKIREVAGCVTVENTQLTSPLFLKKINIMGAGCKGKHRIVDNPNLCSQGQFFGNALIERKNNKDDKSSNDCPCIYSDVERPAAGSLLGPIKCPKIALDEDFDCAKYYPTDLVEVQGTLKMKNCKNLEKTFANLRRIISGTGETPLIIYESSEAPNLEFLKRIEFRSATEDDLKRYFEIYPKMSIDLYLPIAYTYGRMGWLADPIAEKSECYLDARGNIKPSGDSCAKFKGDLVAGVDRRRPKIQEITGCLIVKNVTDLNFLKPLKTLGGKCQYAEYPKSPSYGFEKTTFGQMREEYCPPRALREHLVPVLNMTSIQLSGKEPECAKACTRIIDGNCDSLFGDLTLTQDVYIGNLEIIHGRLSIINTLFEKVIFPKLEKISSKTAPAIIIENNEDLRVVDMELRPEITAADNGRPLVKITKNPKLQQETLSAFLHFYTNCEADPHGLCYLDNSANREYKELFDWNIALPVLLVLLFVISAMAYCLYQRKRRRVLEMRAQRRMGKLKSEMDWTQTGPDSFVMSESTAGQSLAPPPSSQIDSGISAPSLNQMASKRSSRSRENTRTSGSRSREKSKSSSAQKASATRASRTPISRAGSKTPMSRTGSPGTPEAISRTGSVETPAGSRERGK